MARRRRDARAAVVTGARLLVGVDGGNTKTIAIAARPDGSIAGTGRVARGADIHHVPVEDAIAVHQEAVELALAEAGADGRPTGDLTIAFSLAGADWPEDIQLLEERHRARWPTAVVVNDAIGALRGAIPEGPGVVVVCGTGTATGARGPDGRTWHSGFWQQVQGARDLGEQTLRAVFRAELGVDPPTLLTERVLTATGEPSVEALLRSRTARGARPRRDPADLALVLLGAADDGDEVASTIVARQGAGLGATAVAAARQVGIPEDLAFPLALGGGVLRHPATVLRDAIVRAVRAARPAVEIVTPADEPAVGALELAFDAARIAADAEVRERLRAGLSSIDLFDTHPSRLASA